MASGSSTITLKAGGPRTSVDETEAKAIAERFQKEAAADGVVVDTIDLSCRSWKRASLECLRPVLQQVAATVTTLKLDDIIASLPTEEGLESLEFFAQVFGQSPIVDINLDDNALGTRGDLVLKPLFSLPSLQRLSIENCGMSQEVAASLLQALSNLAHLTHLSLGRNQIAAGGAKHVGALLAQCPALQVLNYNGARPLKAGTASLLTGLAQMVQSQAGSSSALVQLNLHDCAVGTPDEEADEHDQTPIQNLCTVLAASPQLTLLNLQEAEVGPDGLELVLAALKESGCHLTHLMLGACELGETGAETLATAVAEMTQLQVLGVDTNELGDEGVTTLIQALAAATSSNLTKLDLECNEIGKSGTQSLLQHRVASLQELNLADNMDVPAGLACKLQEIYPTVHVDEDLEPGDDDDEEEEDAEVAAMSQQIADTSI